MWDRWLKILFPESVTSVCFWPPSGLKPLPAAEQTLQPEAARRSRDGRERQEDRVDSSFLFRHLLKRRLLAGARRWRSVTLAGVIVMAGLLSSVSQIRSERARVIR